MMSCSVKEVDFLNYNCRTRVSATFFYTGDLSLQQLPLIPLYVTISKGFLCLFLLKC